MTKNMLPEQAEAFERGEIKFFTSKRCSKRHISERYVNGGECCECAKLRYAAARKSKAVKVKEVVSSEVVLLDYARARNYKFYFTGKPCKYGHTCRRYVKTQECLDCSKIRIERSKQERLARRKNKEYIPKTNDGIPRAPTIPGARLILGRCQSGGR